MMGLRGRKQPRGHIFSEATYELAMERFDLRLQDLSYKLQVFGASPKLTKLRQKTQHTRDLIAQRWSRERL
jgi:hypothetical protein